MDLVRDDLDVRDPRFVRLRVGTPKDLLVKDPALAFEYDWSESSDLPGLGATRPEKEVASFLGRRGSPEVLRVAGVGRQSGPFRRWARRGKLEFYVKKRKKEKLSQRDGPHPRHH